MFRTSIVHLQERSYAVCCSLVCFDMLWGRRKNCSSSFTLITTGRIETYQIATYSTRTLPKMDYWSPKHVELLNVMNKLIIRYCVPCWITDILQNDTRSVQYQILRGTCSVHLNFVAWRALLTSKISAAGSAKTFVSFYRKAPRQIPEDVTLHRTCNIAF